MEMKANDMKNQYRIGFGLWWSERHENYTAWVEWTTSTNYLIMTYLNKIINLTEKFERFFEDIFTCAYNLKSRRIFMLNFANKTLHNFFKRITILIRKLSDILIPSLSLSLFVSNWNLKKNKYYHGRFTGYS